MLLVTPCGLRRWSLLSVVLMLATSFLKGADPSTVTNAGEILPLRTLEAEARAVTTTEPASVRLLTDDIVRRFWFGSADLALQARLFAAEWTYVTTHTDYIDEAAIPGAVNDLANALALANFTPLNIAQVRAARMLWLTQAPTLLGSRLAKSDPFVSTRMSPAGAVLLAFAIVYERDLRPSFVVEDPNVGIPAAGGMTGGQSVSLHAAVSSQIDAMARVTAAAVNNQRLEGAATHFG